MWPTELVLIVAATFIVAGMVKGVIGMGLPTIALAALTAMQGLGDAMVLLLVPSFVTNFWQACVGGAHREIFRRFWLFLLSGAVCTWFAVGLIEMTDAALLSGLLGVSVVVYAGYGLFG
ncbi:MAG: TSUP family transporter, partial [Rhodospirillales bacterium]|nr:TSUP family transporter [Rhodospirillales bacterium]